MNDCPGRFIVAAIYCYFLKQYLNSFFILSFKICSVPNALKNLDNFFD